MRIYSLVSLLFIKLKIFDTCNVLRLHEARSAAVAVDSEISFGSRNAVWIGHELGCTYIKSCNFALL